MKSEWLLCSAYNQDRMWKRPAQLFALVAMMVSVVNAQCAVSCEIAAPSASRNSAGIAAISVDQEQHGCCPHEGAPEPKQGKPNVPCPQPLPAASQDRAGQSDAGVDSMLTVLLTDSSDQDPPVPAKGRFDSLLLLSTGPAFNQPSSVFILKI